MFANLPDRIAGLLLRRPFLAIAALAGLVYFSLHFFPKIQFSVGLDPYFPEHSNLRATVNEVNETFVNDFNIVVMYETKDKDVLSYESLTSIKALGEKLKTLRLPGEGEQPIITDDFISLLTMNDVESSELSFKTIPLIPNPIPKDKPGLLAIRDRVMNNHVVRENFISPNNPAVGAFVVRLPKTFEDPQRAASVGEVRRVVAEHNAAFGNNMTFYFTGKPVLDADETAIIFRDLSTLIPLVHLVVAGVLLLFLFNLFSVGVAIFAAWLSMEAAQAVIPALGKLYTPTCGTIPLLIVTIAAAYIIHYFAEMAKHRKANPNEDRRVTMRRTVAGILPAALICCLTTAIGFVANAVTDIPALKDYSYFCAIATVITFVVTVLAFCAYAPLALWISNQLARIPGMKRLIDGHEKVANCGLAKSDWMQSTMTALANLHTRHPKKIVFASVTAIVIIFAGVHKIGLGFDQLRNFKEDEPIRVATQMMEDNVGGSTEMIVSIKTSEEDRFMKPEELHKLEALDAFFREEIGANRVLSVVDFTKHMHRGFFNNDPKAYRIPDSVEQAAQLFALNSDLRLYEYITRDHSWVRVVGRVPAQNSYELSKNYQKLDRYLAEHFPASAGYTTSAAGQHRVYAAMTESITDSLSASMVLGTVLIFFLLALFLRSWSAGMYSIPPNIMPVIISLGMMGWLGIRLSADNAIFATIVLGIAMDDTVHFIHYMRERLRVHGSMANAIREALCFKGPAMIGTTVIMVAGFSVMFLSSYQQIINFGFVICIGVGSAVFGDLILLPSLLLVTGSKLGVPAAEMPKATVHGTRERELAGVFVGGRATSNA